MGHPNVPVEVETLRYFALATDYDGTLAYRSTVAPETLAALERLAASGRRLILNTGRHLQELLDVFQAVEVFDRVVLENGAVLYRPATKETTVLGARPPESFVDELLRRGVSPLSVGEVIVATSAAHQATLLEVIHQQGLGLQVIFNKDTAMVLPPSVNKATGLVAALGELGLSVHNAVSVGDGDNDIPALAISECAVAVADALPSLKQQADLITAGNHGEGVQELINRLLDDDLAELAPRLSRHDLRLGRADDGSEVRFAPYGVNVLLAGPSGSGKSTLLVSLLEQLCAAGYQFCLIDPEGDFEDFAHDISLGTTDHAPAPDEVLQVLRAPGANVGVNLLGVGARDRPLFFGGLLTSLQALRARTGRPHFLVADEAHYLLPRTWAPATQLLPLEFNGAVLVAPDPAAIAPTALKMIDLVVAVGGDPAATIESYCRAIGVPRLAVPWHNLNQGEAVAWFRHEVAPPRRFRAVAPSRLLRRHRQKYATGTLGVDKSFYFRGPGHRLNLRAQNLETFMQLVEGVDDATWLYHLRRGDYSRWFREAIKDEGLAREVEQVEARADGQASASRRLVRRAVEARYSLS